MDRDKSKEGLDVYYGEIFRLSSVFSCYKIRNAFFIVKDESGRFIDSFYGYLYSVFLYLDFSIVVGKNLSKNNNNNNRKKMENLRVDFLSFDFSDCVRLFLLKFYKYRKGNKK